MTGGYLVLEDGTTFEGILFGKKTMRTGVLIFQTGADGYQEVLTDPAYSGQIVVMTYPTIGNYGALDGLDQSDRIQANGLVVSELCDEPSPQYGGSPFGAYAEDMGLTGISGVDTRAVTIRIRENGTCRAAIVAEDADIGQVVAELKKGVTDAGIASAPVSDIDNGKGIKVAVLDCGVKKKTLETLSDLFDLTVFPYDASADSIKDAGAKGLVVVGGPRDPADAIFSETVSTIKALSGMPMLGLGSGAQLIALAYGAKTGKLKFGHHGNQPVKFGGRVYMTSQSHDYTVEPASLEAAGFVIDQYNMNDGSVEGFRHGKDPVICVEYRPEGGPGSNETDFIFSEFASLVKGGSQ